MAKRRPAGDGMVRKREDGRWEGRIVIGHRENGEPLFRHVYAKTQKALLDKLHQNIECYRDVELTEDSRMTLGQWLDRWLTEYKAGTVRPGTLEGYRRYIEYYIKPQLGDKQISLLSQQDIQRMYRRLKTEGRIHEHPEMGHQLSDSMVRHIHSTLHAALKDAVQAHVIPRNPTEGTTAPKPNYKPKRILTRAELDAFLTVVEQDEVWRDFFQTELMTGLRRGEICGLQWSDFDEEGGTLKVSYIIYLMAPVLVAWLCLRLSKHLSVCGMECQIEEIELASHSFLPNYLGYFFVALSIPNVTTLIYVYAVIFVFTHLSQALSFNPLFLLFGYQFYFVTGEDGTKIFLITKQKMKVYQDAELNNLRRINDFTFIDMG